MIDLTYKSVVHNLNSIYRVRNDLVHNGGIISSEKENQIRYLQKYLNHFVGILIYYMKRNEAVTIPEILYSIDNTYVRFTRNVQIVNDEMKKYGRRMSDIETGIKEVDNQDEKDDKKKELEELRVEYEIYINENVEPIVFPKYLYLI